MRSKGFLKTISSSRPRSMRWPISVCIPDTAYYIRYTVRDGFLSRLQKSSRLSHQKQSGERGGHRYRGFIDQNGAAAACARRARPRDIRRNRSWPIRANPHRKGGEAPAGKNYGGGAGFDTRGQCDGKTGRFLHTVFFESHYRTQFAQSFGGTTQTNCAYRGAQIHSDGGFRDCTRLVRYSQGRQRAMR